MSVVGLFFQKDKDTIMRIFAVLMMMLFLVTACGSPAPVVDTLYLQTGDSWSVSIKKCPAGSTTTVYLDMLGMGPNGVDMPGGITPVGEEVVREVNCGNGVQRFAFGKVKSVKDQTATIESYTPPQMR